MHYVSEGRHDTNVCLSWVWTVTCEEKHKHRTMSQTLTTAAQIHNRTHTPTWQWKKVLNLIVLFLWGHLSFMSLMTLTNTHTHTASWNRYSIHSCSLSPISCPKKGNSRVQIVSLTYQTFLRFLLQTWSWGRGAVRQTRPSDSLLTPKPPVTAKQETVAWTSCLHYVGHRHTHTDVQYVDTVSTCRQ